MNKFEQVLGSKCSCFGEKGAWVKAGEGGGGFHVTYHGDPSCGQTDRHD